MAPEYAMRGYLTEKADVYSFGVVALEIVSGKSNTNYRPKEEFVYLLDWVRQHDLLSQHSSCFSFLFCHEKTPSFFSSLKFPKNQTDYYASIEENIF